MASRFTRSFLWGLIVSFLFVRSLLNERAGDERLTAQMTRSTLVRSPALARREQAVLLSVFLAGAIAWSLHLMIGYAIGSMGCTYGLERMTLFGLSAIPSLIGLITIPAALISVYASVWSYRRWKNADSDSAIGPGGGRFLVLGAMVLNGLFTVLILFEAFPALVLRPCF